MKLTLLNHLKQTIILQSYFILREKEKFKRIMFAQRRK